MAPQGSKIAVEILQSVNNRTQSLRKILRMVITDIVINTLLGRVTRHPAGMHCPARDDAFVSSFKCNLTSQIQLYYRWSHEMQNRKRQNKLSINVMHYLTDQSESQRDEEMRSARRAQRDRMLIENCSTNNSVLVIGTCF